MVIRRFWIVSELRVGMTKHVHLFKTREQLLIMFVMQTEKAITCFEMCGFDGEGWYESLHDEKFNEMKN